jgi:hypothetical protein
VDDALIVRRFKRFGDLVSDRQRLRARRSASSAKASGKTLIATRD